jgi:hypothetical protein
MKVRPFVRFLGGLCLGFLIAAPTVELFAQAIMQLTDGTFATKAVLYDLAGSAVSVGGGTQYAEDAVHASGNTGTLTLVVRNDAGTALAADGDNIPLMVNSAGALYVASHAVTNAGTFVVQEDGALLTSSQLIDNLVVLEDDAAANATPGIAAFFMRSNTTPTSSCGAANDLCLGSIDANGRVYVNATLYSSAGAELTSTEVTEDAPETAGVTGPMVLGVRRDTAASSATTSGDNATFNFTAEGGLWSANTAAANGGCTIGTTQSFIGGASVNETAIKASAGQIYSISAFSLDATPVYIKLYNDTTANIDETDTPVYRLMVPANSTASLGSGFVFDFGVGLEFGTAITLRTTTGIADNDTGALTANEVLVNVCYQ